MDSRVHELAEQLLVIERELHARGLWASSPPEAQAFMSQEPFCVDTLTFEQWLQWVFLPRMKDILESDSSLPAVSGILAMAEMVYQGRSLEMIGLLRALGAFDKLISRSEE